MLKRTFLAVFAFVFSFAGALPVSAIELNFQSGYPPSQTQQLEIFVPWGDSFAKATNNKLIVHTYPSGALVEPNSVNDALFSGNLDIALWTPSLFPKNFPHSYLYNLPFLAKNARHGYALAYALYDQLPEVKKEIDSMGEMLTMCASASYAISSTKSPIRKPADLKGKRVLIIIPADSTAVEAWGGVPVYVSPGDVYVGLQRGMGEALYCPIPFQKGLRIMELSKHVILVPSATNFMIISVNRDVWDKDLTDEQRKLFKDTTGRAMGQKWSESLDKDVAGILELFKQAGATANLLTPEEMKAFQDGVKPIVEGYWVKSAADAGLGKDSRQWIDRFYQIAAAIPVPE